MPNQAKQRFLELSVNEISVVDTPANEVEFLVMKRMEDDSMETTTETVTETQKDANAEVVTVDAGASEDAAVNKALEQVAGGILGRFLHRTTGEVEARTAHISAGELLSGLLDP